MKQFHARPSKGSLVVFLIAFFVFVLLIFPFFVSDGQNAPVAIYIMNLSLAILICGPMFFFGSQVHKIRYELCDDHLYIHMGRLIRHRVMYADIKQVSKKNLQITLWSSFRLPGLALFKVPYADEGIVRMCATSASKEIILIETESAKYGITPQEEAQFLESLTTKLR